MTDQTENTDDTPGHSMMRTVGKWGFWTTLVLGVFVVAGTVQTGEVVWTMVMASLNGLCMLLWIAGAIEQRLMDITPP